MADRTTTTAPPPSLTGDLDRIGALFEQRTGAEWLAPDGDLLAAARRAAKALAESIDAADRQWYRQNRTRTGYGS